VETGIDSISLAPDTIIKTTIDLKKTEESLGREVFFNSLGCAFWHNKAWPYKAKCRLRRTTVATSQ
jgi:hypothetical protein